MLHVSNERREVTYFTLDQREKTRRKIYFPSPSEHSKRFSWEKRGARDKEARWFPIGVCYFKCNFINRQLPGVSVFKLKINIRRPRNRNFGVILEWTSNKQWAIINGNFVTDRNCCRHKWNCFMVRRTWYTSFRIELNLVALKCSASPVVPVIVLHAPVSFRYTTIAIKNSSLKFLITFTMPRLFHLIVLIRRNDHACW